MKTALCVLSAFLLFALPLSGWADTDYSDCSDRLTQPINWHEDGLKNWAKANEKVAIATQTFVPGIHQKLIAAVFEKSTEGRPASYRLIIKRKDRLLGSLFIDEKPASLNFQKQQQSLVLRTTTLTGETHEYWLKNRSGTHGFENAFLNETISELAPQTHFSPSAIKDFTLPDAVLGAPLAGPSFYEYPKGRVGLYRPRSGHAWNIFNTLPKVPTHYADLLFDQIAYKRGRSGAEIFANTDVLKVLVQEDYTVLVTKGSLYAWPNPRSRKIATFDPLNLGKNGLSFKTAVPFQDAFLGTNGAMVAVTTDHELRFFDLAANAELEGPSPIPSIFKRSAFQFNSAHSIFSLFDANAQELYLVDLPKRMTFLPPIGMDPAYFIQSDLPAKLTRFNYGLKKAISTNLENGVDGKLYLTVVYEDGSIYTFNPLEKIL